MKNLIVVLFVIASGITNSYAQTTKSDIEKVLTHVDISTPEELTIEVFVKTRFNSDNKMLRATTVYSKGDAKKVELLSSGIFITGNNSRYYVSYDHIKSIATYRDDRSIRLFLTD